MQARQPSLPFGDLLSSTGSATAVTALFARLVGTTKSSDFPSAFTPAVPSERFSDRPRGRPGTTRGTDGISRFSRLEFPDMLRFYDSAVPAYRSPISAVRRVAFPLPPRGRHTEVAISEPGTLWVGWPACSPPPCHTRRVTTPGVGFRAERLARPYSYDFFHSLLQTGLSRRFPDQHESKRHIAIPRSYCSNGKASGERPTNHANQRE